MVNLNAVTSSTTEDTENRNMANGPYCLCGLPAPLKVARTAVNFGRRFYGCLNYEEPTRNCGFFMWRDGPTRDDLKALLTEYSLEKEMYKQRYLKLLKERDTLVCQLADLEGHCQKCRTLEGREECSTSEEQVNIGEGLVSKWRQQNVWIALTFALLWQLQR